MGKHSAPSDPAPVPANVTEDTWTKIVAAGVDAKGEDWGRNTLRAAENARNN